MAKTAGQFQQYRNIDRSIENIVRSQASQHEHLYTFLDKNLLRDMIFRIICRYSTRQSKDLDKSNEINN